MATRCRALTVGKKLKNFFQPPISSIYIYDYFHNSKIHLAVRFGGLFLRGYGQRGDLLFGTRIRDDY